MGLLILSSLIVTSLIFGINCEQQSDVDDTMVHLREVPTALYHRYHAGKRLRSHAVLTGVKLNVRKPPQLGMYVEDNQRKLTTKVLGRKLKKMFSRKLKRMQVPMQRPGRRDIASDFPSLRPGKRDIALRSSVDVPFIRPGKRSIPFFRPGKREFTNWKRKFTNGENKFTNGNSKFTMEEREISDSDLMNLLLLSSLDETMMANPATQKLDFKGLQDPMLRRGCTSGFDCANFYNE